jgi:hypothetical protein
VLKSQPALADFYAMEGTAFEAVRLKFAGIKQKLASAAVVAASSLVMMHDYIAPFIAQVDVTAISEKIPSWAWPLIMIAITALFQWLRNLGDKRNEAEKVELVEELEKS